MALAGKICLVTGASRGIGKGIALQLGQAGATVYITGRSDSQSTQKVGGSLKETAEEINSLGGKAIPVVCDHKKDEQIKDLFEKIESESGKLDVLVNNAYSAVNFIMEETSNKRKFWQCELEPGAAWDEVNRVGLRNHYICSVYAVKMMEESNSGLIINVSSGGGLRYLFNVAYGTGKAAMDRMGADMAVELKKTNITILTLWPGPVQTEHIAAIRSDAKGSDDPDRRRMNAAFENAESCEYSGKAVVGLALDKNVKKKAGKINIVAELAQDYGFDDNGVKRPSMRQLNYLLNSSGWRTTASYVPDWVKLPGFVLHLAGNKF